MKLDDLYNRVMEAANKAQSASDEYVRREEQLKVYIERVCEQKGITDPTSAEYKTIEDDYKDNDKTLNKAFGRWYFWQREQMRRSDLVRTHIAYCQFYGKMPASLRPRGAFDAIDESTFAPLAETP